MAQEIEFMPDRLNEEPVVFLSMTNSEIKWVLMVFFVIWTPLCVLAGLVFGKVSVGLATVPGMVLLSMWVAGKRLKVIKRGKPKQYHILAMHAWLQDHGMASRSLIRETRVWDIQRWRSR